MNIKEYEISELERYARLSFALTVAILVVVQFPYLVFISQYISTNPEIVIFLDKPFLFVLLVSPFGMYEYINKRRRVYLWLYSAVIWLSTIIYVMQLFKGIEYVWVYVIPHMLLLFMSVIIFLILVVPNKALK